MRFYVNIILLIGLLVIVDSLVFAATPGEADGIKLERTRVIYPASAKRGITFTVTNQTSQVYLLQSRVVPWVTSSTVDNQVKVNESTDSAASNVVDKSDGSPEVPFIVLPPLTRFEPQEAITLRILSTANDFPQDRESIFTLSLKTIPSQSAPDSESADSGTKMVLALQNNLKLFYRPKEIVIMKEPERARALQFSVQDSELIVKNPTPYYVTFGEVRLGSELVELQANRMLAPFSTAAYKIASTANKTVSWEIIDDDGQRTPLQRKSLD